MTPPLDLVAVPGTPFVVLANDHHFLSEAIKAKTIMLETSIANLPEVKALGPDDFVLDVGAYIGDTALIFAANGAHVFGFEPQDDAHRAALSNVAENPRIVVFRLPIGNGELVKVNQDAMNGNPGTRTVSKTKDGEKAVRLDDIGSWWGEHVCRVTFVKIDVEGFEPSVIQGALKLLARDKPTLLIEVYPEMLARQGYTKEDIYLPLLGMGYEIREAIGNSSEPRWDVICKIPQRAGETKIVDVFPAEDGICPRDGEPCESAGRGKECCGEKEGM